MKTVRMTLDEALVEDGDRAASSLGTTRSGLTRDALRSALSELRHKKFEARHRAGYERNPVTPGALDAWQDEQIWPN